MIDDKVQTDSIGRSTVSAASNRSAIPRFERHGPLILVLKQAIQHEEERIERAEHEILKLKMELLELGVELPIGE